MNTTSSTIYAIREAKQAYEDHMSRHGCTIMSGPCADRRALWLAYMAEADAWGKSTSSPLVVENGDGK